MFNSSLANEMTDFLELRKEIVTKETFNQDKAVLKLIDSFMVEQNYDKTCLSEEMLGLWISTLTGKTKTINAKIITIRNFTKYLNSIGYNSFMPDLLKVKSDYIPYIYSDKEIKSIIYYADNLKSKYSKYCNNITLIEIPIIIRILYGCGTRLGETLELKRKDINFDEETIFLRKTKFSKERLIPMHKSLTDIIKQYCTILGIMNQQEAYLFPSRLSNNHLSKKAVQLWFEQILVLANIDKKENTNGRGACLHCFRHLFVLKSMQQLEKSGHSVDMNDLLLPTYLGHECLIDTDKYMKFSGVQVPESLETFANFTSGLFPKVEVHYEEE